MTGAGRLTPLEDLAGPLRSWLAAQVGAGQIVVGELSRPAAGQSNDTVLFVAEVDGRQERLVLRQQASGTTIFREPDVVREAQVLQGLAGSAVPVPAVRWIEPDPAVLGAPFFVMEQIEGRVPLGKPSIHAVGWLPDLTTAERARLWHSAMEVLVALHAVDWRTTHPFLADDIDPVDALLDWYRWSTAGRSFPITDAAAEHVTGHAERLAAGDWLLLWGDARVGNMLFGPDHTVAAALDWETATTGPAERDVAHWLFFDEFGTTAVGIERLPGWPDRDTTIARYESLSGRRLDDLLPFDVLDGLFMATTLIRQADARVARGEAPPDTRMGHDNTVTQMLARLLHLPEPELSPDYLAHRGTPIPGRNP